MRRWLLTGLLLWLAGGIGFWRGEAAGPPLVLILNSYHPGLEWSDAEQAGARRELEATGQALDVRVEFLDWKHFGEAINEQRCFDLIEHKYLATPPVVVLALDDGAFNFTLRHRSRLFPSAQIVFCGVNAETYHAPTNQAGITGLVEMPDIAGTLQLMARLVPERKRVWVVHSTDSGGLATRALVEREAVPFTNSLAIRYSPAMTLAGLESALREVKSDECVLLTQFHQDSAGWVSQNREALVRRVVAWCPAPVFVTHSANLEDIGLGGSVLSGDLIGRATGKIAARLLAGETADRIPISPRSPSVIAVDHAQLRRFGIPLGRVPPAAVIMHQPDTIWSRHQHELPWVIASLAVLGLSLLAVSANNLNLRRSRAALRESEARYRRVVESNVTGMAFWQPDGRVTDANAAFLRLTGYTDDDLRAGRITWGQLTPTEYAALDQKAWEEMKNKGVCTPYEKECICRDGRRVRILVGSALFGEEVEGRVAFVVDVTERHRAESALRTSEERYRGVVEAQTEFLVQWRPDGTRTFVNESYARYYGRTRAELEGSSFFPLVPPEDAARIREKLARLTPAVPVEADEHRSIMPDGSLRWHHWVDRGIFDPAGNLVELLSVGRDITERKQAERRMEVFSELGRQLSAVSRRETAGRIVLAAADELLGWDAASLDLYDVGRHVMQPVLALDLIDGQRQDVPPGYADMPPSPLIASILREGGRLIDRSKPDEAGTQDLVPFGDRERRSMALLFAPMREGNLVIGVLSIQSYRPGHYGPEAVEILQTLADHAAGAFERIRAAEALRLSERRYRALAETNAIGIWQIDAAGKTVYANPAMLAMLELERAEDLEDRAARDFFPPGAPAWLDPLAAQRPQGIASSQEMVILGWRGGKRHVVASCVPLLSADGKSPGMISTFADMTDRKRMEEALRISEERYRGLVDDARDAIFTLSLDGAITSLNPAFETITGWRREEWLQKFYQEIVAEEDRPRAQEMFLAVMRGEKPPAFELRIRGKDGAVVPLEFTVTPQWYQGKLAGLLGISRDTRDRKQLEEQLRQMQKLESIGQLAAGVAHDFNNLLTIQQGYLSFLSSEPGLPPAAMDAVRQAVAASERAANLTRQLLLFSRKQVMQPRQADLNEIVRQMTRLLGRLLGEQITLRYSTAGSLPPIHADPGMIEQIVMNLAVNARDAMPSGGVLTIGTSLVTLGEESFRQNPEARAGAFVCLSVMDTGTGIAPEIASRIFEPFFTTKGVGKGTGLGLATVYGIAKQHRGWVEMRSVSGRGSQFRVYIPASQTSDGAAGETTPTAKMAGRGSETILVVEDEPALRDMVRHVLERQGYKVHTASSGPDALDVWARHRGEIQMLLTDMVMPEGMNGRELADKLLPDKPELKVMFVSGYSADMFGRQRLLEPGQRFLQKPFQTKELLQTMRECLDGSPAS